MTKASTVSEAVATRRTVRAFLDKPVDPAVLRRVLERAQQSPSGGNTQPWNAVMLTGEPLARLFALVAETIPQREDQLVFEEDGYYGTGNTSVYICDNLDRLDEDNDAEDSTRAKDFLHHLGMPYGFCVFSHVPDGVERQRARVECLLFAAYIAEQRDHL